MQALLNIQGIPNDTFKMKNMTVAHLNELKGKNSIILKLFLKDRIKHIH